MPGKYRTRCMESLLYLSSSAEKDRIECLKKNKHVLTKRHVFDVIKVVLQLLDGVFDGGAVRIGDLRPPGDSGFHIVPQAVVRNALAQHVHEVRPLWPGAGEAHVAAEDVECLRDFVETK